MRYNPTTEQARTIEELAAESRAVISRLPEPAPSGRTWCPDSLTYTTSRTEPILWDCVYIDNKGNDRCWVLYADNIKHVIESFNELVGEGRIISILPAAEWS